jgi:hypothetical protein
VIGRLHRLLDDPVRSLVGMTDLVDGVPDTPEGAELAGLIRGLEK